MRWPDERYVRAYVRDTTEWCLLSWQARALFWELLRKVDLSGFVAIGKAGLRGLALVVRMPVEVVEDALRGPDGLLADGCVVEVEGGLLMPNYVEAQQARSSDKLRKQEQRARDAASKLATVTPGDRGDESGQPVTPGDQTGQSVTHRDKQSQNVTECHQPSPAVTVGHSVLSLAKPSQAEPIGEASQATAPTLAVEVTPKPKANRGTRCPSSVDPDVEAFCERWNIPSPRANREVAKMLDHFAATPGHRGLKTLWDATWRRWSERAGDFASNSRGPVRSVQPATPRTTMTLDEYVASPENQGDF